MDINNYDTLAVRAAVIEPVGGHGGMDYYDFALCNSIRAVGTDVVLFTCDEAGILENAEFSVNKVYSRIYSKEPAGLRALRFLVGSIRALAHCLRQKRTICHFHWFNVGPLELFNAVLSRVVGRSVVVTAHDVESLAEKSLLPFIVRLAYRQCSAVIAHNDWTREELIEKCGISASNIHVIPHGNYIDALGRIPDRAAAKRKLGIPISSKTLLFFGQIKDAKGLDVLLDAMRRVIRECPDALLVIAGKVWKTDFSEYDRLIDRYGIRSNIRLKIQYIPNDEVPYYYAAADLVVLPYKKIYQSGVLLMAMSSGRPVLVSDLPAMVEVVTNNENGLIFHVGDAEDLAEKIVKALGNADQLDALGANGAKLMRSRFDWSKIGRAVAFVYASCVSA